MGGTAISALTTVKLYANVGEKAPFVITAVVLAVYAVVSWLLLRDAPGRTPPTTPPITAVIVALPAATAVIATGGHPPSAP